MLRRSAKPGWYLVEGKDRYWDGKKWLETQDMAEPGWYEVEGIARFWDGDSWQELDAAVSAWYLAMMRLSSFSGYLVSGESSETMC